MSRYVRSYEQIYTHPIYFFTSLDQNNIINTDLDYKVMIYKPTHPHTYEYLARLDYEYTIHIIRYFR